MENTNIENLETGKIDDKNSTSRAQYTSDIRVNSRS